MPRPRPPRLHREVNRHGKVVWYFRPYKGRRVRINAEYGTPDFEAKYQAAFNGTPLAAKGPDSRSLAWLLNQYRDSGDWLVRLSPATRRQRDNIFAGVVAKSGRKPYAAVSETDIVAGRDRRSKTPFQSKNFMDAMRGLFRWAKKAGHRKDDPTAGVRNLARPKTHGFKKWDESAVDLYKQRWPLGTKERVWLAALLTTGLRRGDAVAFGRQHIKVVKLPDGRQLKLGVIMTEKSGRTVQAIFPITAEFEEAILAGPCGDLTFIVGKSGRPMTKESFGNGFREACNKAGVSGSAHGLRKFRAVYAVHLGLTTAMMRALFGWIDDAMPAHYTKDADRMRLAIEAAIIMANVEGTSIPAPLHPVREFDKKAQ